MKTFEELGVSEEIRRAIEEMGYVYPMPVQEEVIPYLLEDGHDVVALAQTGTGKTAAFGLPLIQKTDVGDNHPQSLILCPTINREPDTRTEGRGAYYRGDSRASARPYGA